MAHEAKVLVVLPISDEIEYINGCLDSILNSSLNGVEIAVTSGYLQSEMCEKIDWYTKKYDRVHLYKKESAEEAIKSAVCGIKSEYVFFMNIFDQLIPNTLEKYYDAASVEGAEIVFGRVNYRRNSLTFISDLLPFSDSAHIADEYLAGLANGKYKDEDKWSKMYSSTLIKDNLEVFSKYEDTEFLAYIFSYAAHFVYIDFVALECDQMALEEARKDELEWMLPEDVTKKRLSGIEFCYTEGNSVRIEVLSRVLIRQLNKYIVESKGATEFEELRDKIEKGEESRRQALAEKERREMEAAKKKNKGTAWWVKWIIFAVIALRLIAKITSLIQGF